ASQPAAARLRDHRHGGEQCSQQHGSERCGFPDHGVLLPAQFLAVVPGAFTVNSAAEEIDCLLILSLICTVILYRPGSNGVRETSFPRVICWPVWPSSAEVSLLRTTSVKAVPSIR